MNRHDMETTHASNGQCPGDDDVEREIDRLSLAQALLDVDVANARVTDLTQRLITLTDELASHERELVATRAELASLRTAHQGLIATHADLVSEHDRVKYSRAYRLASGIASIRKALNV
jgi:predicted ATPase